ncbi:GntR family transcriptional regulator [Pseudomonas sp. GD03860]|uniref:FadR/GntR family transcriptional regulator n=1 Tax=Pseudomonas TaxID=286 RepID=UPI0023631DBB|nr:MULTISPECIES: GntR family transcriptional regulator [Pseudomonas]MDD2058430.1 GntR family transcriptional regulator [Pseudomonas putida]MDH0640242.1 GntR family transcriptional regulator [Pseudomonas sp. GD03860]
MTNASATIALSSSPRKQPLQIPKAPQIVASRLKKLIVSGQLKEGDLLPAESKLMEEFGVSRPTIREAYRILEAERLVTVSRGAKGGAVIHAPDPGLISNYALMVLQCEGTRVAEVYQARLAVEPAAVRMVAAKAKKTAPAILRASLEAERAVVEDAAAFAQAIAEFHRLVVELSGNRPLIHLWGAIHEVVVQHQALAVSAYRRTTQAEEIVANAAYGLRSQEKLIKLIEAGDEDGAELHWRKHMQAANKTWIAGYEETTIAEIMQD